MKLKNKIFVRLLIIIMLICCTTFSFAEEKKYDTYLALGDSITEGYALRQETDCFAYQLKEKYQVKNYENLAKTGMTTKEFSEIIKTEKYKNAIKNADLITISMGSNELLDIVQDAFTQVTGITMERMHNYDSFNKLVTSKIFGNSKMDFLIKGYELLQEFYNELNKPETKKKLDNVVNQETENLIE